MRIGVFDGSPAASAERVIAAREALGPGIDLMCDAHGTFTVSEARQFCHLVRDCASGVVRGAGDGRRQARAGRGAALATHIPIASGESECTRFDFRDLIELRAADILQPDLAICGGITEAMRIRRARERGEPAPGAAPVGRRAGLRRRPACGGGLAGRASFSSIRSAPTR